MRTPSMGWDVLLIGGASGVGKTSVSYQLAHCFDIDIASLYATLVEDEGIRERVFAIIKAEFDRTCDVILQITGQAALLDNEPTLQKSIRLRNPYVDPLNYIQVEMIRCLRALSKTTGNSA